PASGPSVILTVCPIDKYGQASTDAPELTTVWRDSISFCDNIAGCAPLRSIRITPGVRTIATLINGSCWQNTYPGNKGTCSSLARSDHFLLIQYKGKNTSYPLLVRIDDTTNSWLGLTWTTNHPASPLPIAITAVLNH